MLLDDLYQTIEKLRERIETHQDKLKQSEALTRNALVDPLLRALGWDTEDPALAMPEYRLGSGFADYALLNGGKPAIVIEAKKLGTPLYSAAEQSVTYCVNAGIRYFVATDGRKWDVYETHRPVPLAEKKIVSFDIMDSPADVCLDALVLWRRSVQSGTVRKAQTPLLEPENEVPPVKPEPSPDINYITPTPDSDWQLLTQLKSVAKGRMPSAEIRFPDGSTAQIKEWYSITVEIVRWLCQQGKLDETHIPVQGKAKGTYILSNKPCNSPNSKRKDFYSPQRIGKWYIPGDAGTAKAQVENAISIVEKVGKEVTPEQFSVRLS